MLKIAFEEKKTQGSSINRESVSLPRLYTGHIWLTITINEAQSCQENDGPSLDPLQALVKIAGDRL
jgi:hypothetical protein